ILVGRLLTRVTYAGKQRSRPRAADFVTDLAAVDATDDVYFDPYDVAINADPYPVFRRLREEAPLYYNATHDFYALSRYQDVTRGIVDHGSFSSAKGAILELIRAEFPIPSGVLIFEDPPVHD